MLGLAEFRAWSAELLRLGTRYDKAIADSLVDVSNKQVAIKTARSHIPSYMKEYRKLLNDALQEISKHAVSNYADRLGIDIDEEELAQKITADQYEQAYYGMTLNQRLAVNERRLNRVATQTGQVGIPELSGLFTNQVPFGAQFNVDKRILQGTAIKIERDAAQKTAELGNIELVRWTLAKGHKVPCRCEELANTINIDVEEYMKKNKIVGSAKGLFFRDELPDPPHPNCQCEFGMIGKRRTGGTGSVKRALKTVQKLLRRLRGK